MLERATRIRWTREVVAFLNGENDGRTLGCDPGWAWPPPSGELREEAEKDLRIVAREMHNRREEAHRSAIERKNIRIPDDIRNSLGGKWLGGKDADRPIISLGLFTYDTHGCAVLGSGGSFPTEAVLVLTIAELLATDSPVEVKVCQDEKCDKLFADELHGKRAPKRYCCAQHSARQRKLRFWRSKRKRK